MKKPVLSIEEAEPKKATRADRPPTEGFVMVVDGHFKSEFAAAEAAEAAGRKLDRVADRAQDLADLAAQEDEGDDRNDRDEREDQGVLSEALAFLVPVKGGEEPEIHVVDDGHFVPPG